MNLPRIPPGSVRDVLHRFDVSTGRYLGFIVRERGRDYSDRDDLADTPPPDAPAGMFPYRTGIGQPYYVPKGWELRAEAAT